MNRRRTFLGFDPDEWAKILGAILVSIYVLGFIVLSFHFSSYGFYETSPFKPRIVEAGICTLVFVGAPCVLALFVNKFELNGLRGAWLFFGRLAAVPILSLFVESAPGLASDIDRNRVDNTVIPPGVSGVGHVSIYFGFQVIVWLLCVGVFVLGRKIAQSIPKVVVVLVILLEFWYFWALSGSQVPPVNPVYWWCVVIAGILTLLGEIQRSRSDNRNEPNAEIEGSAEEPGVTGWAALVVVGLLLSSGAGWWFIAKIYPFLPARLGGGRPVPTIMQIKEADNTTVCSISADLIDEAERGFYVDYKKAHTALFIPREEVLLVFFDQKTSILSACPDNIFP